MKKFKLLLVLFLSFFIFNSKVFAGAILSVSNSSVYAGDSFTVTVNLNSVAAWNIHVSSSGPVSNCVINQANVTDDALDTSKSFSATCSTTGTGTVKLSLSGDITSAADGIAVPVSGTKSVTVKEKPKSEDTTKTGEKKNESTSNNNMQKVDNNKSSNNNLKSLEVEGFKLETSDKIKYTLTVSNSTEKINIKTVKEDEKASIKGDGQKNISVGDNTFNVVVTAENGSSKTYTIVVTRKDSKYRFSDFNDALSDKNVDVNILLDDNNLITKEYLEKISKSGKTFNFNKVDDKDNILYTWIIDGNKVSYNDGFDTGLSFNINNKESLDELINYADCMYINFKNKGDFPDGVKIKFLVDDKYKNDKNLKLYYFNEEDNSIELVSDNLVVKNGYIETNVSKGSKYVLTRATISTPVMNDFLTAESENKFNIYKVISFVCIAIIIGLLIFLFLKYKKNSNNKDNVLNDTMDNDIIINTKESFDQSIINSKVDNFNNTFNQNFNFDNMNQSVNNNEYFNSQNIVTNNNEANWFNTDDINNQNINNNNL